jgi:hypothetical protein
MLFVSKETIKSPWQFQHEGLLALAWRLDTVQNLCELFLAMQET